MEKINANDIIEAIGYNNTKPSQIKVNSNLKITVYNLINIVDMMSFVKFVVDNCFDDETSEYRPEVKDFATRCAIYEYYTDVDLPGDTSEAYAFVYNTGNIIDDIISRVNQGQFNAIIDAINDKIESIVSANTSVASYHVQEIYKNMSDIADQFKMMFDGISKEDIDNFFKAMSANGINEEKFVKSYLEQRSRGGSDGVN